MKINFIYYFLIMGMLQLPIAIQFEKQIEISVLEAQSQGQISRSPVILNQSVTIQNVSVGSINTTTALIPQESTFLQKMKESCSGMNAFACVAAGLSAAQLVMTIANYFDSKKVKDASACQGAFCNSSTTASQGPNSNSHGPINPYTYQVTDLNDPLAPTLIEAQSALRDLQKKGYTVDVATGSVRTPKGTLTQDQIAQMAASGLSEAEKSALQAALEESKKTNGTSGDFDGASSETGSGKKKSGAGYADGGMGGGFNMNAYLKSLEEKGQRGVAGYSIQYGKDKVGVEEADIFEQMSRAYKRDKILGGK